MENIKVDQGVSTNFFVQLLDGIKRNGIFVTIISMFVFIVVYQVIINPNSVSDIVNKSIEMKVARDKDEHNALLRKREDFNNIIPLLLHKYLIKVHASNALVLELHNGGSNLAGLPFLHFSATLETYVNELGFEHHKYIAQYLQSQPTGMFTDIFELMDADFLSLKRGESKWEYINYIMSINNIGEIKLYPMYNIVDNTLVAVLVVAYKNEDGNIESWRDINEIRRKCENLLYVLPRAFRMSLN